MPELLEILSELSEFPEFWIIVLAIIRIRIQMVITFSLDPNPDSGLLIEIRIKILMCSSLIESDWKIGNNSSLDIHVTRLI